MLNDDIKSVVKHSYEENDYMDKYRNRELFAFEKMVFDKVLELLPFDANILDLGCGNGYPYDCYFNNKGYKLIGIDFCKKIFKMLKLITKMQIIFVVILMDIGLIKNMI